MSSSIEVRRQQEGSLAEEIKNLAPHINSPVPNPAPLGLFAFGLTTALLQMKHTKLTGANVEDLIGVENLVWGFGLFYGGLLQIIAGLCEIKRNNMFGFTAFLSYGAFWMSISTAEILVRLYSVISATNENISVDFISINPKGVQAMLIIMGIFTFILWICTFKQNIAICSLIFSLMLTFFLLAAGIDDYNTDKAAGWFGIITSAIAFFIGGAELINDIIGGGEELIPLGHFDNNEFRFFGGMHVAGRVHGVTVDGGLQRSDFGPRGDKTTLSTRSKKDEKEPLNPNARVDVETD